MSIAAANRTRLSAAVLLLLTDLSSAHPATPAIGRLDIGAEGATYRLTMIPAEVGEPAQSLVRGADGDAELARRAVDGLRQHLAMAIDGQPCRLGRTRLQPIGEALTVTMEWRCPARGALLTWHDSTARLLGEHHRTITSVDSSDSQHRGTRREYLFDHNNTDVTVELGQPPPAGTTAFFTLGLRHILEGLDHLLFLAALLLGRRDLRGLLLTVTTFTVAHSASLAASALGVVQVSTVLVEAVVAASVIWASMANLSPRPATFARQSITFVFGLVHGLAFSEALVPLGLDGWQMARALLGFNLGVEAAQALLVAACVPMMRLVERHAPRRHLEVMLSICIAIVGTAWLIQRLPPL